jgi:hypothetical protein
MQNNTLLAVFAVIAIVNIAYMALYGAKSEGYRPCSDCDAYANLPAAGLVRLNPFDWPYSANSDPNAAYRFAPVQAAPLTHLRTPDHVVLTN